ncbi:MAG TPA: peptidoglycan DD-metalloendopeptidase family protein [Baekduia sp.]|nr:peptidoglycan DD-metalloendopeptidase family protein [Baekduia sp.]
MVHDLRTPAAAVLAAAALTAPWVIPAASGDGPRATGMAPEAAVGTLEAQRISLTGPRPQRLVLRLPAGGAQRVHVVLVGGGVRRPVGVWRLGAVQGGGTRTVTWDGRRPDGRPAPAGRYRFLAAVDDGPPAPVAAAFEFVRGFFPVRGPHRFGDGLGAGRGHEGQDMTAPCGTPVVAARGGRVRETGSDAVRGHYVVVDPAGADGASTAYLHLLEPAAVAPGTHVTTGQPLGLVGSTGRSSGCHLHFEMWSAPGYGVGRPVDPSRRLRRWDAQTGGGRHLGS